MIGGPSDLPRLAWASSEAAEFYERVRPGYAPDAIAFIADQFGIAPGTCVVDLGAGTGKLTRQLMTLGAKVIGVEPLEGMRSAFSRALPDVPILAGRAEAIPLPDADVDIIVAGQAWHWFDGSQAVTEASRLLKPRGGIALLWNEYDTRAPWISEYANIRKRAAMRVGARAPSHTNDHWRRAFSARRDWTALQKAEFFHQVDVTREGFVDRVLSSSVFAVLSQDEQDVVTTEIVAMLDRESATRDHDAIAVPYITEVFWSRFRPG